ncbi:phosphoribosyltransferase [Chamaesiphon polymorphus]|uniref:Phosphoribosyl transferase n=1 Tax=Chamaesiphon polymorphus CCALA 037 TaxID=2107692 RepID=A0A2T1GBU4_9CYAN|nr:phosphoribosyltransferase [Chamaesiphon polymorphus]PSB54822.1 phosphoribosyl transferase [Chamaesiphon polymorphus CCALA 037]
MNKRFRDRAEAGKLLAQQLLDYANRPQAIVLALPRGGVPVAYPIAQMLELALDICLVHKLGVPSNPELAMGAIDLQGAIYLNERIVRSMDISKATIDRIATMELRELQRRDRTYRGDRAEIDLRDRIAIVVDDGLATGATMKAAIEAIRRQQPAQIVIAVPVAFQGTIDELRASVDRIVCLMMPAPFEAIGCWYDDFSQTTDAEVCAALQVGMKS